MALAKGAGLEELVRAYFARQGFVAIRSVSIQFEDEEVTDVDVWLTYGDAGDSRVQSSINSVLSVISTGVKNGRALARQTRDALDEMFKGVRAEIIAEFFSKDQNVGHLFTVARELEARAQAV